MNLVVNIQDAEPKEEWKEIPFLPGFTISNLGNVRKTGLFLYVRANCYDPERILPLVKVGVYLYFDAYPYKPSRYPVHSTMLKTFVGPCPEGFECNHKDTDTFRNVLWNLEWTPITDNRSHKGSVNGSSKLKEGEVWLIKKILATGRAGKDKPISYKCLDQMFKMGKGNAAKIAKGIKWRHVAL